MPLSQSCARRRTTRPDRRDGRRASSVSSPERIVSLLQFDEVVPLLLHLASVDTPILAVEVAAVAVMGAYLGLRFRRGRAEGVAFLRDAGFVTGAAWVGEDTCIRLYGFYEYAPGWHGWADRVPLFVALIWPFVVLSARDLGRRLAPSRPVLAAGAVVWADATLIEGIATTSGLWSWSRPGPFGVPLIAPFGWACFAVAVLLALQGPWKLPRPGAVLVGPALTHVFLITSWWGFFRWVSPPLDEWSFTGAIFAMCAVLTVLALRWRRRAGVPLDEMLARLAAATVFFGLVAVLHRDHAALQIFTASFVPPWLALMSGGQWPKRRVGGSNESGSSGSPATTHGPLKGSGPSS